MSSTDVAAIASARLLQTAGSYSTLTPVESFKTHEPRVALVILNWRQPQITIDCVLSVLALDYGNIDIIICDNDSGDGSIEAITAGLNLALPKVNETRQARGWPNLYLDAVASNATAPECRPGARRLWIAATGRNGGYAFGNNVGIRLALLAEDVEYLWILNNDTIVSEHALRPMVSRMIGDPTIGICGAKVLYFRENGTVQALGGGHFLPYRARCEQIGEGLPADTEIDARSVEAKLSYVNGAAAFVRRSLIEQVGYMDEGYFLYWEELDWATRARASGKFRLAYCPDSIVYHRVGSATGSNDHGLPTLSSTYWMTRSKFRYLRLHRPASLIIAFPLLFKAAAREILARRRSRAKVMLRAAFGLPAKS